MGLASFISGLFKRKPAQTARAPMEKQGRPQVHVVETPGTTSRFATDIDRLNRSHWQRAHGQSINSDLATHLRSLMAWCQWEYALNPNFEGVCNTYVKDVVGRDGPRLQVRSKNKEFNRIVAAGWRHVFSDPDPSHRFSGVESLKTNVLALMLAGSFVNVYANVKRAKTPLTFGWRTIHPRRMGTPPEFASDPDVAFGIRLLRATGEPVTYYFDEPERHGPFALEGINYKAVPAEAVQHVFIPTEGEQLTGYPLMTSTLGTAADIFQYDKIVMEAAKNAASHAIGLEATNPEWIVDPDPIGADTLPYSAGEVNVAPPGYKWATHQATQPAAQYVEFRRERIAELGRPIHMPLLVVMLTAAEANFSSAQWEGMVYGDGIDNLQGVIDRRCLNPSVEMLIIELAMRGMVRVPDEYELSWSWNVPSHANFEKFIAALEKAVSMGAIAISDASALLGYNWDEVQDAREAAMKDNDARKLPQPPQNVGKVPPEPADDEAPPKKKAKKPVKRNSYARVAITR